MRYEVEALTPTIIGGRDKIQGFEFVREKDYLYLVDFDRLFEENFFREGFVNELIRGLSENSRAFNLRDVLRRYNMDLKSAAKYKVKLEGVKKFSREIVPFVKSAGRAYIPGSSLKGAIRSFLTKALTPDLMKYYKEALDKRHGEQGRGDANNVSKEAEERAFSSPYESPFKYLHISDSSFLPFDDVAVFEIKVMNICNDGVKWFAGRNYNVDNPDSAFSILAEGLRQNAKVMGSIKVEPAFVHGNGAVDGLKEKVGINVSADTPAEFLAGLVRAVAKEYLHRELSFYSKYHQTEMVLEYRRLLNILHSLAPNQFLLQVGFSTGYLSKTVGMSFKEDDFEKLKEIDGKSKIYPQIFPKTRRIIFKDGRPCTVPGWIKVTIK